MPETNPDQTAPDRPPLEPAEPIDGTPDQPPVDLIDGTPDQPPEPVEPIDRMIADLHLWLDDTEARLAQAAEEARIPDDIPRFVTRYQP